MSDDTGVVFPSDPDDGRRSTSAAGRAIVSAALGEVDPVGAAAARRETNWRQGYVGHFRRLVEAGLDDPGHARTIAWNGLAATHDTMRWIGADGEERPLADAFAEDAFAEDAVEAGADADPGGDAATATPGGPLATETVSGSGDAEAASSIPRHGERLRGDALRRQLDDWVERGIVEPGLREAVHLVLDNPDWLRLEGRTVVVLGAAAEMGPLRSLLRWGATVAAMDLPRQQLWSGVLKDATGSAGRLLVPVRGGRSDTSAKAGADLITELPAVTDWVSGIEGPLVIGNYVYADGATNVRVSTAVDALTDEVRRRRPVGDVELSFLATPTDVFAVPAAAVHMSTETYLTRRTSRLLRVPLRTVSGGRLLRRNYVPGEDPGVNDSIVSQQGPNYLLAKRIQRWRATTARSEGLTVSLKVAPPTRTRSVVKNRALAAAYAGAHRFGIEVFEPGTSNTLMAALLVHDLVTGSPAQPHPWQDEAEAAAHGGLWTAAYDPRSALGLAALLGAAAR